MICNGCGYDWTGFTGLHEGEEVPLEELLSSIDKCPECPDLEEAPDGAECVELQKPA